jgi:hypothetical protein
VKPGEATMNAMAAAIMLMLQSLPSWAHPGPSASLLVAAPGPPRDCVDAKGQEAECGEDPTVWHECYAADQYGRCPPDPKCFDRQFTQVRCAPPVDYKMTSCVDGTSVRLKDVKKTCAGPREPRP